MAHSRQLQSQAADHKSEGIHGRDRHRANIGGEFSEDSCGSPLPPRRWDYSRLVCHGGYGSETGGAMSRDGWADGDAERAPARRNELSSVGLLPAPAFCHSAATYPQPWSRRHAVSALILGLQERLRRPGNSRCHGVCRGSSRCHHRPRAGAVVAPGRADEVPVASSGGRPLATASARLRVIAVQAAGRYGHLGGDVNAQSIIPSLELPSRQARTYLRRIRS